MLAASLGPVIYFAAWFFCRRPGIRLFEVENIFRLGSQLSPLGVWMTAFGALLGFIGVSMMAILVL